LSLGSRHGAENSEGPMTDQGAGDGGQ
jgi:hypothetical protein